MAVRHIDIEFSTAPTKSQSQRFFSLILQNVTNFSGYTTDPVIGSYLTGGGIVTVNAIGDNMPVTVVNEWNVGTANAVTLLQIGNLYYVVANNTSSNNCTLACSLDSASYMVQSSTRTFVNIGASMYSSAESVVVLDSLLKYRMRISESYFAFAANAISGTVGTAGYSNYWIGSMYVKHDSDLIFVRRSDVWRYIGNASDKSEMQVTGAIVIYPNSQKNNNKPVRTTIITNLGPLIDTYQNANPLGQSASTAYNSGYAAYLPAMIKDVSSGLDKKPVFQFKVYDMNVDKRFDVSGIHNVLMTAYSKQEDYADVVTNGGTTYRAVGSFLFAS